MFMRVYWRKLGGHVHCRVFSGPHAFQTLGKCGDLVFRLGEWLEVKERLERIADMVEEE